jgi:hypothetical protein
MLSPIVLKMVNKHLAELSRKYTAIRKGDPRAVAIAEELSQIITVRDEIQRIWEKLGRSGASPKNLPSESPTVETLLRRMDELARQFAETPREDLLKPEIANEITRLAFSLTLSPNQGMTKSSLEPSGKRSGNDRPRPRPTIAQHQDAGTKKVNT